MLLLDLRSLTWKAVVGGQDRAINHILSRFYAADGWWQQQQLRLLQVPLQKNIHYRGGGILWGFSLLLLL